MYVGATQGNIIGEVSLFQGVLISRGVLLAGLVQHLTLMPSICVI